MSLFNLPVEHKDKVVTSHPWQRTVRDIFKEKSKYVHNSLYNPHYVVKKEKRVPHKDRVEFTVIGNRVTREFIYCVHLVRRLHKYRWKLFDAPVVKGVTGVEWPLVLNELKLQHGGLAFCIKGQVAVLYNGRLLGGHQELVELISQKYILNLQLDYEKESLAQFIGYVNSSGRPFAFMHMAIAGNYIGTMIFMLYADILPNTCENFLRLCQQKKGGYSGTPVHRIVGDCWIQCGGFGLKNTPLDCENFIIPHDRRGVLGMANAGRHMDCSTQFFVALQPMPWMQHKYVAFGQLIDGDSVLQQIERVPTWYEAPTQKVIIQNAGVLNLECQEIKINPKANEYIQGHIENLVVIGELFLQVLMERVYLEIEFRRVQRMEPLCTEGEEEERRQKDMRAAARYNRKREEWEKQVEKAVTETMDSRRSSARGSRCAGADTPDGTPRDQHDQNDQFDVETYSYEFEEPTHRNHPPPSKASSPPPRPEVPFYIPLTDVPYPDEIDSNFDLRRFVRGYYCLESDLPEEPEKMIKKKMTDYRSKEMICDKPNIIFGVEADDKDDEDQLDSDEEWEIKNYLKYNGDRVSFAGGVVKSIAKAQEGMLNLFQYSRKSELITDDQLRRVRLASIAPELRGKDAKGKGREKKHRRPTAFIHPAELKKLILERENDEDEDDDKKDSYEDKDKVEGSHDHKESFKVRIQPSEKDEMPRSGNIRRRPTAFVPLGKHKFSSVHDDDDGDDDGEPVDSIPQERIEPVPDTGKKVKPVKAPGLAPRPIAFALKDEDEDKDAKPTDDTTTKVRISVAEDTAPEERAAAHKSHDEDEDGKYDQKVRPSLLARLYEDMFDDDEGPTLKNYKPLSEMQRHNLLFVTYSPTHHIKYEPDDPAEQYTRPSIEMEGYYGQLVLQHGTKVVGKISSDYVNTIEQIERQNLAERSIRGLEYARTRPTMSVSEYQKRNLKYQGEHKQSSNPPLATPGKSKQAGSGNKTDKDKSKRRGRGLRLPGDSPLFSGSLIAITEQRNK